jgi:hypothetical protein
MAMAFITENPLVRFGIVSTTEQNFILLPTHVLHEMPLLPGIPNRASREIGYYAASVTQILEGITAVHKVFT